MPRRMGEQTKSCRCDWQRRCEARFHLLGAWSRRRTWHPRRRWEDRWVKAMVRIPWRRSRVGSGSLWSSSFGARCLPTTARWSRLRGGPVNSTTGTLAPAAARSAWARARLCTGRPVFAPTVLSFSCVHRGLSLCRRSFVENTAAVAAEGSTWVRGPAALSLGRGWGGKARERA